MDQRYDLRELGARVREQQKGETDPIVEARHIMSDTILAHVLLALSDCSFYEYVSRHDEISIADAVRELDLDPFCFRALLEYLVGVGAMRFSDRSDPPDRLELTEKGTRYFNVYTRGVLNVYLGGYGRVLHRLPEILARKLPLDSPALARSTRHAAAGTAYSTCAFTIPSVFKAIGAQGAKTCLDLGCGTGDFLIQFVLSDASARGIGVDMSASALAQARASAEAFGVSDRLTFFEAAVGPNPLTVPREALEQVDIITSMYMLHEFGRDGRQAVVDVIRSLKQQMPARKLLVLEVEACEVETYSQGPKPAHYGRLDYRLIHQLSRQGLPLAPEEWHAIFADAGCTMLERGIATGGSFIYLART